MAEVGAGRMLRLGRVVAAFVLLVVAAVRGEAQTPGAQGGRVAPRKSREELVREWDLNSDGTIDQSEAELAASRMRRERAEMRLNSGIDPVTGLPRGELPVASEPLDADAAVKKLFPYEEPNAEAEADRRKSKPLPGTRVPQPTLPGHTLPGHTSPGPKLPVTGQATEQPRAEGERTATPPGIAGTRADADRRRQSLTGGVRAGGLAARPGYGAPAPTAPLNAGLPIPPKARPTRMPSTQPRGGLVPGPRTPAPTPAPAVSPSRPRGMYDPY